MADLKSIKKITKNINGQEVGLQVESAIRDGQGNVISDTYVGLKTIGDPLPASVYTKPFMLESSFKRVNEGATVPTEPQYVLDGRSGTGFALQSLWDPDEAVNLISAMGSETSKFLTYNIDGQKAMESNATIAVGESFLTSNIADLLISGKNTMFIGECANTSENPETGSVTLSDFSRPAVVTSGTFDGNIINLNAEHVALTSDIPTSYNDLTDKVAIVSGDDARLEVTQTNNTFTITPKGSGESSQWIEFGATNQLVPSASLVVGGIFFEEQ